LVFQLESEEIQTSGFLVVDPKNWAAA